MNNKNLGNVKIIKNIIFSFSAQVFSLITSFVLGFIVPKMIDEYQYAYWQTFVLYVGYVGLLHFGLIDGIILRYSQFDYSELDRNTVRSQFYVILTGVCIFAGIGLIISVFAPINYTTKWIIALVSLGIITKNIFTYAIYTLQMTNQIGNYTTTIIIQRVAYAIFVLMFLVLHFNDFRILCSCELIGDLVGITYAVIKSRELYIGPALKIKDAFKETKSNFLAGVFLLLANLSSSLILGSAKMMVNFKWDELTFGKVSFAFSVSSLFLVFSSATSVVFFPTIKRIDSNNYPRVFSLFRKSISCLLFCLLVSYFPLSYILQNWLPNYSLSLKYMGLLLPMVVFSSKISLVSDNFLKAYRKEKALFKLNIFFMIFALLVFSISTFVLQNLNILMLSIVLVLMLKSFAAEYYLMRITNTFKYIEFFEDFGMTLLFIISSSIVNGIMGLILYACCIFVYIFLNRKFIKQCQLFIKKRK